MERDDEPDTPLAMSSEGAMLFDSAPGLAFTKVRYRLESSTTCNALSGVKVRSRNYQSALVSHRQALVRPVFDVSKNASISN